MHFFHSFIYSLPSQFFRHTCSETMHLKGPISENPAPNIFPFHLPSTQPGSLGSTFQFWHGSYSLEYLLHF